MMIHVFPAGRLCSLRRALLLWLLPPLALADMIAGTIQDQVWRAIQVQHVCARVKWAYTAASSLIRMPAKDIGSRTFWSVPASL